MLYSASSSTCGKLFGKAATMKTIAAIAFVALLTGCAGSRSSVPPAGQLTSQTGSREPQYVTIQPGFGVEYLDTYAPVGPCQPGVLTIMSGRAPVTSLSFPAGQGPPLVVSNCNFFTPQNVIVYLNTPTYGAPVLRYTNQTITVDAPGPAQVTATWSAAGAPGPESAIRSPQSKTPLGTATPSPTATVTFTIGAPQSGNLSRRIQL